MSWKSLREVERVRILDLSPFVDDRGSLSEFWRNDELRYRSAAYRPAMGYVSWTKVGMARGPHEHEAQADLFVFAGPGDFAIYLWDVNGKRWVFKVGESAPQAIMVPPGVVHAYKCLSGTQQGGLVINLPDRLFRGVQKKGEVDEIRHEDDPDSPFKIE